MICISRLFCLSGSQTGFYRGRLINFYDFFFSFDNFDERSKIAPINSGIIQNGFDKSIVFPLMALIKCGKVFRAGFGLFKMASFVFHFFLTKTVQNY